MRRYSSAKLALRFIAGRIDRAVTAGQRWLPGIRRLCRQGGFSPATCRRALATLAAQGRCLVTPGGGTLVVRTPAPAPSPTVAAAPAVAAPARQYTHRSEEIRERLSHDLLAGVFRSGASLPLCKVLAGRYGTSHATLGVALDHLVADGRLRKERRRYHVPELRDAPLRSALVLIAHADSVLDLIGYTPRMDEQLRCIERATMRLGLHVEPLSFRDAVPWNARAQRLMSRQSPWAVCGFVVWSLGLNEDDLQRLAARLAPLGKPVAVLDESGATALPQAMAGNPLFHIVNMAFTATCGRDMGKYLFERGHRNVAFFTDEPGQPYSRNRALGLETYLRENAAGSLRVWPLGPPRAQYGRLEIPPDAEPYRSIAHLAEQLVARLGRGRADSNPHRMLFQRQLEMLRDTRFIGEHMAPQMRAALDCSEVTAWVAASDRLAYLLLDFLAENRVAVPGALSVAGFDNVPEALNAGLTTYDFNVSAVVDAMVGHVLTRPRRLRAPGPAVEVPGFVVERRTSGPARRR